MEVWIFLWKEKTKEHWCVHEWIIYTNGNNKQIQKYALKADPSAQSFPMERITD